MTRLADLVATSNAVAATASRREKVARLAAALRRLTPDEIEIGVAMLCGEMRQGRLGIGYATLADVPAGAAAHASLGLRALYAAPLRHPAPGAGDA